jgi:hypothetical protein
VKRRRSLTKANPNRIKQIIEEAISALEPAQSRSEDFRMRVEEDIDCVSKMRESWSLLPNIPKASKAKRQLVQLAASFRKAKSAATSDWIQCLVFGVMPEAFEEYYWPADTPADAIDELRKPRTDYDRFIANLGRIIESAERITSSKFEYIDEHCCPVKSGG